MFEAMILASDVSLSMLCDALETLYSLLDLVGPANKKIQEGSCRRRVLDGDIACYNLETLTAIDSTRHDAGGRGKTRPTASIAM